LLCRVNRDAAFIDPSRCNFGEKSVLYLYHNSSLTPVDKPLLFQLLCWGEGCERENNKHLVPNLPSSRRAQFAPVNSLFHLFFFSSHLSPSLFFHFTISFSDPPFPLFSLPLSSFPFHPSLLFFFFVPTASWVKLLSGTGCKVHRIIGERIPEKDS